LDTPVTTGKEGVSAPPLAVELPGEKGRFYVLNPQDREAAIADPGAAIAAKIAVPSITTCIGSLDKPALVPWAAGMAAEDAEKKIRSYIDADQSTREQLEAEWFAVDRRSGKTQLRRTIAAAHRTKTEQAQARGTEVHALCEQIAAGADVTVEEPLQGYVSAYRDFLDEYSGIDFEYLETTVGAGEAGYAGTTDAIAIIDGRRYIIDLKTTGKDKPVVYPNVGLQLAAAANADNIVYSDGTVGQVPSIDGGLAVSITASGRYSVFAFDVSRGGANHQGFLASLGGWHWQRACGSVGRPRSREELNRRPS